MTIKFDLDEIEGHAEGLTWFGVALLCVVCAGIFVLFKTAPDTRNKSKCENTEARKLVSETQFKDGTVECVYIRNQARTLKEIVK